MTEGHSRLVGTALVVVAAIAFSGKAIIIKLAYRHGVDAVTLLALRMVFSAPLFAVLAWWALRDPSVQPLAPAERPPQRHRALQEAHPERGGEDG